MNIIRYIIWTTNFEDTKKVASVLTPFSTLIISISDSMVCVETNLSTNKIRSHIGDELEMACLEIEESLIKKLMSSKFNEKEKNNFIKFLNLTKIPKTIDEGLDLIIKRGGLEFLNDREVAALKRLGSAKTI